MKWSRIPNSNREHDEFTLPTLIHASRGEIANIRSMGRYQECHALNSLASMGHENSLSIRQASGEKKDKPSTSDWTILVSDSRISAESAQAGTYQAFFPSLLWLIYSTTGTWKWQSRLGMTRNAPNTPLFSHGHVTIMAQMH
jgi:hypothetical protein